MHYTGTLCVLLFFMYIFIYIFISFTCINFGSFHLLLLLSRTFLGYLEVF